MISRLSTLSSKFLPRNFNHLQKFAGYNSTAAMGEKSDSAKSGLPLNKVLDTIRSFANDDLAASWDNVGLLIEPTQPKLITHTLITNDLTEDVMQEAVDLDANLIISYHPPIFAPLKSITTRTWKVLHKIIVKTLSIFEQSLTFFGR